MEKNIDFTRGNITKSLINLSIPIIATNFIQTTYGMIDMIWVGKLGSNAVAAIGTASFFVNLALAIFSIVIVGSGVRVSQSIGAKNEGETKEYIKNAFLLSIIVVIMYSIFILIYKKSLIGFFDLNSFEIDSMAEKYLMHSVIGIIFMCFNSILTTILNSFGNSRLPFRINSIGLIVNIILDPILIFGFGSIKGTGVVGAAVATNISRLIVLIIFLICSREYISIKHSTHRFNFNKIIEVIKMGMPVTVQRITFIMISIIVAKIVSRFGAEAIAVQKIGVQLESISYMTIGGIQGAIAAYVGQNYGANNFGRIVEGYLKALSITIIFGIMVSIIFIVAPRQLFSLFIKEKDVLELGVNYMRILGFSQVFMCMELLTVGAFNGMGKTYIPPIISIIFTVARIPIALVLSKENFFGLNGIWMSISLSSVIKGLILISWFIFVIKRFSKVEENNYYI